MSILVTTVNTIANSNAKILTFQQIKSDIKIICSPICKKITDTQLGCLFSQAFNLPYKVRTSHHDRPKYHFIRKHLCNIDNPVEVLNKIPELNLKGGKSKTFVGPPNFQLPRGTINKIQRSVYNHEVSLSPKPKVATPSSTSTRNITAIE